MAANPFMHDVSHSTTTTKNGWSSSRIATTAVFCALALVVSFVEIPVFPPAPWLKYDPSGIVAMVAGFAFGPTTGVLVAGISWALHLLFKFDPWGVLMALVALVAYVAPAAAIHAKSPSRKSAVVGMAISSVVTLVVCIAANLVITPIYAGMPVEAVAAMIVPILLPFNVIKVVITSVASALLYGPITKMLAR